MVARSISRHACAFVCGMLLLPDRAVASEPPSCAALTELTDLAGRKAPASASVISLARELGATTCGTALAPKGMNEVHCRWDFPYRSEPATDVWNRLAERVMGCLGARPVAPEPGVNHPDSFAQQRFEAEGINLSLSLKDKVALRQSLVFLRASARQPNE